MSGVLNKMVDDQDQLDAATDIAIRAGMPQRCEYHSDTMLGTDDTNCTDAYKLGNALMSKGDPLVSIFKGHRRAMTDKIKAAIESFGMGCCYSCDQ